MSAVMEKKPKAKKKMAPIAQPVTIAGNVQMLAVTQLTRHPDNRQPSEAAIAAVAESLRTEGQIEPLIVRPLSGESQSYQIVSGETRWLAAQRLGWDSIACDVVALDDAAALRVLAAANAARQDLDPLAKARLIVRLCDPIESGGSGLTREQAAKMFDLQSGGAASNLVRLLELPEAWHGPIERGDLPQSFARALLPLLALGAESPAWGATFEEWDRRGADQYASFASRAAVEEMVDGLLIDYSRPVEKKDARGYYKETGSYEHHPLRFKLTPSLEEELRIVELPIHGKTLRRATNCALYDSCQIPAIKAWEAKRNKGRAAADDEDSAEPDTPLTPRQLAAADAERREKAAEVLAKRVERWRAAWLRELVAEAILHDDHADLAVRIVAWQQTRVTKLSYKDLENLSLAEWLGNHWQGDDDPWRGMLRSRGQGAIQDLVAHWLRVPQRDGYEHPMPDDKVEDLVELLKIDLGGRWDLLQHAKQERYQEFFELHNSEQLDELGQELGVGTAGAAKKTAKVALFLAAAKTLKLPRCLRPLRGKRGT